MDESVRVVEGRTLTIPCEATGRPNPAIAWTAPHSRHFTSDLPPVRQLSATADAPARRALPSKAKHSNLNFCPK